MDCKCENCKNKSSDSWLCTNRNIMILKKLPDYARLATIEDFNNSGRREVGLKYFLKNKIYFEQHILTYECNLPELIQKIKNNEIFV